MRRQEQGFTLIELVMVIVILGILAAVAIPRYLDLTADAQNATKSAGGAAVGSAIAIAAARAKAAPTAALVVAELPGTACSVILGVANVIQGKVNVPLLGVAPAVIDTCGGATAVAGAGPAAYSV